MAAYTVFKAFEAKAVPDDVLFAVRKATGDYGWLDEYEQHEIGKAAREARDRVGLLFMLGKAAAVQATEGEVAAIKERAAAFAKLDAWLLANGAAAGETVLILN